MTVNGAEAITASNFPTIDWNATSGKGVIKNKPTIPTVSTAGKTGSYTDLTNKPMIPTITSGTEDMTAGTSALATGALYFVYE